MVNLFPFEFKPPIFCRGLSLMWLLKCIIPDWNLQVITNNVILQQDSDGPKKNVFDTEPCSMHIDAYLNLQSRFLTRYNW